MWLHLGPDTTQTDVNQYHKHLQYNIGGGWGGGKPQSGGSGSGWGVNPFKMQ